MRVSVEMDEKGRIRVESDQDQLDVADASFVLDLGKMYIQSEWLRKMEESYHDEAEPESGAESRSEPVVADE